MARAFTKTYYATGTPPGSASAAALTFTDEAGNSASVIPIAWARHMHVRVVNPDAADDIDLSFRTKLDKTNEEDFVEVGTLANPQDATTNTMFSKAAVDPELIGDRLQVFWANEDVAAGTADSVVILFLSD